MLLANGADVNLADHKGLAPLHWAAEADEHDAPEICLALLGAGADDAQETSKGMTPLGLAFAPAAANALQGLAYEHLPRTEAQVKEQRRMDKAAEAEEKARAAALNKASSGKRPAGGSGSVVPKAAKAAKTEEQLQEQRRREEAAEAARRAKAARDERRKKLEEEEREAAREDAVCGVCGEGVSTDNNMIVFCGGTRKADGRICGVAVHQECYGISHLGHLDDSPEAEWYCDECKGGGTGRAGIKKCQLCQETSGAERPDDWPARSHFAAWPMNASVTPNGQRGFVHTICALAHEELREEDSGAAAARDDGSDNGSNDQLMSDQVRDQKVRGVLPTSLGGPPHTTSLGGPPYTTSLCGPPHTTSLGGPPHPTSLGATWQDMLMLPPRFTWAPGKHDFDITRRKKLQCFKCPKGSRGDGCVQCVYGKCARAVHPMCAARHGLLRVKKGNLARSAYCEQHLPPITWEDDDDDDEEVVSRRRSERHAQLVYELATAWPGGVEAFEEAMRAIGGGGGGRCGMKDVQMMREPLLGCLRGGLTDRKKRPLSLSDMWRYPPAAARGAQSAAPSLIHALAVAPGGRQCAGREASTTDGISMALGAALKTEDQALATSRAEEEEPPADVADAERTTPLPMEGDGGAAPDACVPCDDDDGGEPADAPEAERAAERAGDVGTPATAMLSRRVPPSAGRRGLRQCRYGCADGAPAHLATAARTLRFCGHSPFSAALAGGYVERALWLYRASCDADDGAHDAPPLPPAATHGGSVHGSSVVTDETPLGDGADATATPPAAPPSPVDPALALNALGRSLTPLVEGQTRVVQLLMLLGAQALMPGAPASAQADAARTACADGVWPVVGGVTAGKWDLSCGAEIGLPEVVLGDDGGRPPPFVYINECVAVDVVPQWATGKVGCKCCETRKRFCAHSTERGCACRMKHGECGQGCGCITRPEGCANRPLQRGLRKRLKVRTTDGKGWCVAHIDRLNFERRYRFC